MTGRFGLSVWLQLKSSEIASLVSDAKSSLIAGQRNETVRLTTTEAFELFSSGRQDKITRKQFFDFLRINEYFSNRARRRRINLVTSAVSGDDALEPLWTYFSVGLWKRARVNEHETL